MTEEHTPNSNNERHITCEFFIKKKLSLFLRRDIKTKNRQKCKVWRRLQRAWCGSGCMFLVYYLWLKYTAIIIKYKELKQNEIKSRQAQKQDECRTRPEMNLMWIVTWIGGKQGQLKCSFSGVKALECEGDIRT